MTRAEATALGWTIESSKREPLWAGDTEERWWFFGEHPNLSPTREMAESEEQLLEMISEKERFLASRGLSPRWPAVVPVKSAEPS